MILLMAAVYGVRILDKSYKFGWDVEGVCVSAVLSSCG